MPNLAYKQPALQRNKPMDYAKPAGSKMKKKTTTKKTVAKKATTKKTASKKTTTKKEKASDKQ